MALGNKKPSDLQFMFELSSEGFCDNLRSRVRPENLARRSTVSQRSRGLNSNQRSTGYELESYSCSKKGTVSAFLLRGLDSNQRPPGYEFES